MSFTGLYQHSFSHVPPGFKRGNLVVVALFQADSLLLSCKDIYPDNIFRLIGGGIEESDETVIASGLRELQEETTITTQITSAFHACTHQHELHESSTGTNYQLNLEIIVANLDDSFSPAPKEEISQIKALNRFEFKQLINRYHNLDATLEKQFSGNSHFLWKDWATIFNLANQCIYDHWKDWIQG